MAFWVIALIILAAAVGAQVLLARFSRKPQGQKPATLGDFNFPTVEEARVITVMRGTCKQSGLNYLEVGDYKVEPIYKETRNPATFGLSKTKTKTGDKYHAGAIMSFGLGSGMAAYPAKLREIFVDDISVWTGNVTSGTLTINKPSLHGGDDRQGGYVAYVDYYAGQWPNATNTYWKNIVLSGVNYVAYDGELLLIQRGASAGRIGDSLSGYFSTSTTVPAIAAVFEICPPVFGDVAKAVVNDGDYNAANFFYEFVNNTEWGLQEPSSRIDLASFLAAQTTFYNEGMGVSVQIESRRKIKDFIRDLERLCDARLYFDAETGLWTLQLIRDDYNPLTIPVLDESIVEEYTELSVNTTVESINKVNVGYIDKATWKERNVDGKNSAERYNQDYEISADFSMWGCANGELASYLALRETRHLALELPRGSLRCTRQGGAVKPGTAFWLKRQSAGWPDRIMRCVSKADGTLKNGSITFEYVQDVFAITSAQFGTPAPAPGGSLSAGAANATNVIFEEQPYFLSGSAVRLIIYAKQPNGSQVEFDSYISEDGGTTYVLRDTRDDFCPVASVVAAYAWNTGAVDVSSLVVTDLGGLGRIQSVSNGDLTKGFNLFRWETGEYCACTSVTDLGSGQYRLNNVWRGLLDTTPVNHASGEKIYFFTYGNAIPDSVYLVGSSVRAKLLTITINDILPIGSATAYLLTTAGRYGRPIAPANITINGSATSDTIPASGSDITLAWFERDRIRQTTVLKQDDASITVEIAATYTVKVYSGAGTLLATYADLTGLSWVHTIALQTTDGSAAETSLIYVIYTVKNGINSWLPQIRRVKRPAGTVPTATPAYVLSGSPVTPIPGDATSIGGVPISGAPDSTNNTPVYNPTTGEIEWTAGGITSLPDASTTVKGVVKLNIPPLVAGNPIALGANDPRLDLIFDVDSIMTDTDGDVLSDYDGDVLLELD